VNIAHDPFLDPHIQIKRHDGAAVKRPDRMPKQSPLKAVFDRSAALFGLILLAPVMLAIAALILMRRDGPVFFSHVRVGRDGRLFHCHKFRTMVPNGSCLFDQILAIDPIARDDWQVRRKIFRDPRVSRFGAFLRSSSLDELPQLWNVLRGDISLVGPRPITLEELAQYGDHARDYLSVRPGITGAWQVSGRSDATFAERVALDVDYVRNPSFARDVAILLRTVGVVLRRQGAA
jgi:lipopolysaccharide/colanic/teichoic acid biosynthesis glycosyltransferase